MFAFIVRRLAQAVVVMAVVAFIAFILFQYVGDPVVFMLGQDATAEQVRQLRADLGFDRYFFVQFWHFLTNAAQGEFGISLRQGAEYWEIVTAVPQPPGADPNDPVEQTEIFYPIEPTHASRRQ